MWKVFVVIGSFLTGCVAMRPEEFSEGTPEFDPVAFFEGETASAGVIENRRGEPMKRVFTRTEGRLEAGVLYLEQDLEIGREKSHRSWKIRRVGDHKVEATANDVAGVIRGRSYGNAFHWAFTLRTNPGNPLANVRMSQWMYLMPDGKTMMNHTTITKAGIVVAQVSEVFRKER